MTEKFIMETAFTDEVNTKEAAIKTVLKEAKDQGLKVKPLAWKVVESNDGKAWQVLAESHEGDFDKEFPVEVDDIVDPPLEDLPGEDEEPESTDDKVDELVDKVDDLVEKVEELIGDDEPDFEDDEDFESLGDPDLDSVETFDDDDDKFFSSRKAKAAVARRKKKVALAKKRAALRERRLAAQKKSSVEILKAPAKDREGNVIPKGEALKSAKAQIRNNKSLRGFKLARFGIDKGAGKYVAEYRKP